MSELGGDIPRPVESYDLPPPDFEDFFGVPIARHYKSYASQQLPDSDSPWDDDPAITAEQDTSQQPPSDTHDGLSPELTGIIDTPRVKDALWRFVTDEGTDATFRAALRDLPRPEDGLVDALVRKEELRSALAAAVRGGPATLQTRWFFVRYLCATGRSAELDRLDAGPGTSSPVAGVTRLFADEVSVIAQLHDDWAAATSEAPLRDRRDGPKPVPVWLDVAAPAHRQITTSGLCRHFQAAHTVRTEASTAVADANNCRWRTSDHYHVSQMRISFDPLMDDMRAKTALTRLVEDPSDTGRLWDFQLALRDLVAPPENGPTRMRVPVESTHHTEIVDADAIQTGDESRLTVHSKYVIEETELPFVAMLADDRTLVRRFVAVFGEGGEEAMRPFLRAVAKSAGRLPDLDLISGASDLPREDTLLSCLFGVARVEDASAVMIGTGNQLEMAMRVKRPGLDRQDLRTALDEMRVKLQPPEAPPAALDSVMPTGPKRSHPPTILSEPIPAEPPQRNPSRDRGFEL